MDLNIFTQQKKKKSKKETILITKEAKIQRIDEHLELSFRTKKAMKKYLNLMFFSPTSSIITDSEEEAGEFFASSIKEGVEGLMFKSLDASYKPGLRTGTMTKIKETKEDIDVVILGAEYGKGKRAGFYSSFFVGAKNDDYADENHAYLEIGKVSSGIKELEGDGVSMENLMNVLKPLKINEKNGIIKFEPKIVIQVRYQEIQKSTTYNSGYALRFPRIISLREDKLLEEINTIGDIRNFLKS